MATLERKLTQSAEKRLMKELAMMKSERDLGITVNLSRTPGGVETLDAWDLVIAGPVSSPFEGYNLRAIMKFPNQYPYHPPSFKFLSSVFHPNVYEDGNVCISILHTDQDEIIDSDIRDSTWTPGLNVRTVCLSIISLLNEPNIFSAANVDASKLYRDDRTLYVKTLKERLEGGTRDVKKEEL